MGSISFPSSVRPYSTPRGHGLIVPAIGEAVIDHLAQAVRQHLLGDPVQIPLQLVEAPRRAFKLRRISSFHFPPIKDTAVATGQAGSSSFVFMAIHLRTQYSTSFFACTVIKRCVLVAEYAVAVH